MKKGKIKIIIIVTLVIITITILFSVVYFIAKHKDSNTSNKFSLKYCEGSNCDDTIEMLKNTQTAWTLTEINNKGEYIYQKHSFINFNGTGENRFAFFKNDDEVKGDFTINEKKEIMLIPSDNKTNKITCKLGEEKDLIAVMYCDKNFGTFTLQKAGILDLPSIILETTSKTKSIKIKNRRENNIITNESKINTIISVINNAKVWTGPINLPGPKYQVELFDAKNNSIADILYNPGNYFTIEINGKSYSLTSIDSDLLENVLN